MIRKLYFHFPAFHYANRAMELWWEKQDATGAKRTVFCISSDGVTDVSVTNKFLADQQGFAAFLKEHFAKRHTVHNEPQVVQP